MGTGPLVVYYFNRISLVGLLYNLILVPLMGFANTLLSLLAAVMVFLCQPLAKILTALNSFILEISLALVDLFSRVPMASHRVVTPTIPEVLLIYGILILAANLKRWKPGRPVGVLEMHSALAYNFMEDDVEVLKRVADVIGALICRK